MGYENKIINICRSRFNQERNTWEYYICEENCSIVLDKNGTVWYALMTEVEKNSNRPYWQILHEPTGCRLGKVYKTGKEAAKECKIIQENFPNAEVITPEITKKIRELLND